MVFAKKIEETTLRKQPSYVLHAVTVHFGTLERGHYISYVKVGAQWFKCDDATVRADGPPRQAHPRNRI